MVKAPTTRAGPGGSVWHIAVRGGNETWRAACRASIGLREQGLRPAEGVPRHQRCQSAACRARWPALPVQVAPDAETLEREAREWEVETLHDFSTGNHPDKDAR